MSSASDDELDAVHLDTLSGTKIQRANYDFAGRVDGVGLFQVDRKVVDVDGISNRILNKWQIGGENWTEDNWIHFFSLSFSGIYLISIEVQLCGWLTGFAFKKINFRFVLSLAPKYPHKTIAK